MSYQDGEKLECEKPECEECKKLNEECEKCEECEKLKCEKCKKLEREKNWFTIIKWIMRVISIGILLSVLIIFSLEVANDLPTVRNEYVQISKFPAPPTFTEDNGRYTGKSDPKDLTFPSNQSSKGLKRILFKFNVINDTIVDGGIPAFTINIFDSVNKTMADEMYNQAVIDKYFESSTLFTTSNFRKNRYFLGRNIK
ncbi:12988_t:CDS:2 [Racocetra fulgida]|uniref:12988_t:CDS:1 n=1 Tax=Racocetra fulgida TaxID=60492 RepID=A0A9N9A4Z6_9GLOM|nr:12988_t:CDS:2 [Racocetra fulgida]